ncbi:MAG: N-acetyltransferase [Thermoflexales bacterium]|nr:N-acetyltransferase [Thermoflexales bacterium]
MTISTEPTFTRSIALRDGTAVHFRPLTATDGARLGDYFCTLSEATRARFGPHSLDRATADHLCATLDPSQTIRFVATCASADSIIAYCILMLHVTEHEQARFAQYGLELASTFDCTVAPSVADAYQNQGLGVPLLKHVIECARQLGRRSVVLLGGVQVTNERAVHVYQRLGFRTIGTFEYPGSCWNADMRLELLSQ